MFFFAGRGKIKFVNTFVLDANKKGVLRQICVKHNSFSQNRQEKKYLFENYIYLCSRCC